MGQIKRFLRGTNDQGKPPALAGRLDRQVRKPAKDGAKKLEDGSALGAGEASPRRNGPGKNDSWLRLLRKGRRPKTPKKAKQIQAKTSETPNQENKSANNN